MEIWKGVTHASLTDSQRKDRATQLLIKYKSGALVTQSVPSLHRKSKIMILWPDETITDMLSMGVQLYWCSALDRGYVARLT